MITLGTPMIIEGLPPKNIWWVAAGLDEPEECRISVPTTAVAGTTFAGKAPTLLVYDDTDGGWGLGHGKGYVESYYEGVPCGSLAGLSAVASFAYGRGQITYIMWDWDYSSPTWADGFDGGWQGILDASVSLTDGQPVGVFIKATKFNDTVTLAKGVVTATNLDDVFRMGKGKDKVKAGDGTDIILGGKQNDIIIGQKGDDWIWGQRGNDQLWSGPGNDNILFDKAVGRKAGIDEVMDFTDRKDKFLLRQDRFDDLSLGDLTPHEFNAYFKVKDNGKIKYKGSDAKGAIAKVDPDLAGVIDHTDFLIYV